MNEVLSLIDTIDSECLNSRINVLEALICECDKADNLVAESMRMNNGDFTIFQESSWVTPSKNESTARKVLLAIPRMIALMIQALKEAIKGCLEKMGDKPKASKLAKNKKDKEITLSTGMKVLFLGAAAGAGTAAYTQSKINKVKTKQLQDARASHEVTKVEAIANIKRVPTITVDESGNTSLLLSINFEDIMNSMVTFWNSIMSRLETMCREATTRGTVADFEKQLNQLIFDAKNPKANVLQVFTPNWNEELGQKPNEFDPKEKYTSMSEYRKDISKFSEKSFIDRFTKYGDKILDYIVAGYKSYDTDKDRANSPKSVSEYTQKAAPYAKKIMEGLKELFEFLSSYLQKLTMYVADSFKEISRLENKAKLEKSKEETKKDSDKKEE